ncbi:MAG: HAMP domain-containing protein [Acidobacteria bacterium]|nr:HAMP domain-containing protein [Acidobacteriota bacterium]
MSKLLWRILLATTMALTLLFAVIGWILQDHFLRIATQSLQDEVSASFRAYESLWHARADKLASISKVLSSMSDVRAAFGTGDQATIRDSAGELWSKVSSEGALFIVTDPKGRVLACLGGDCGAMPSHIAAVESASPRFPKQASGFLVQDGRLFQTTITPVYVESGRGPALLDVLVAGYIVSPTLARDFKEATGGSDFVFTARGVTVASTLPPGGDLSDYSMLSKPLMDVAGQSIGELRILRSFEAAQRRIAAVRRDIVLIWLAAMCAGFALTWSLARRILRPVQELDRAAAEIGRGNYHAEIEVNSRDELGRLAKTFNAMCASIRQAREELIRQERISTIGRLSTSIVHDLRNPLAAIYGGAEMLVDDELSPGQVKRLALNIYRSSRRVQEMLQDLSDVTRGKTQSVESCRLLDVVRAAIEPFSAAAETNRVSVSCDIAADIELPLERSRMERVFGNLMSNAIDAMPNGGRVLVTAERQGNSVLVRFNDNGPGISETIASRLFQPFVTASKKNGLGLGLALSRQTVLDHGGDLWVQSSPGAGATFFVRLVTASAG